jgi:hypothetical protein
VSETPGRRVDQTNVATPPDTGTGSQRKQPTDYLPFLLVALGLAGSGLAVRRGSKAT